MTTITTAGHQRPPLIAVLAVGAALVVGGALGVAWEANNDTPAATPTPTVTSDSFGGATTSDEFSGTTSGSLPATGSPGGATTSQESTQHHSGVQLGE